MPKAGGAPKLLRRLVERGLDPDALHVAARLVVELDAIARETAAARRAA